MSDVLWRRMAYMLSPQLDIYSHIAPHLKGKDVLEVGFGTGMGTLQFTPYARWIEAIEPDCEAVNFANKTLPGQAIWLQGDITTTRPAGRHDAVVMIEVLEHVKDWRLALANVYKTLKPGGVLYMSARNANADLRRNELHEREWTASEFRAALQEFFPTVELYDYTLTTVQGDTTRMTPLIGKAIK
jgi:2-polyprenyl-3-methyl-5-hydroxy-6-metoxy-1,4-benzoquinol methylase